MQLWNLFVESQLWKTRASELMGIEDPYLSYCFDQAVGEFGSYVKAEIESVQGRNAKDTDGKRTLRLRALLSGDPKAKFAQPVATTTIHPKDGSNA